MDDFKKHMNPPESNQSEKTVHDAFTKDGNKDMKPDKCNDLIADKNTVKDTGKCLDKSNDKDLDITPVQEQKKTRGNKENLVDMRYLTAEKQREIAVAGGKASVEARRKKKELKDRCKILLEMMPNKALIAKSLGNDTELPEGADMYDLMIAKMMQVAALDGNVKAFEAVRDSAGDKPTDKVQQDIAVMTDKDKELMAIIEARMSAGKGQST